MTDYTELKRLAEIMIRDMDCDLSDSDAQKFHEHLSDWEVATAPKAILALIAENERLSKNSKEWEEAAMHWMAERDQLKAEVEALQANASLINLLPELDEALEDLQIHGQHGDQGYRKLKDWYRKIALACKAIDAAMSEEAGHD